MLQEAEFTQWMLDRQYPLLTPQHYLRDLRTVERELGLPIEPVSVANTENILQQLRAAAAAGPADVAHTMRNYVAALGRYHEFRTGHLATGCLPRDRHHQVADPKGTGIRLGSLTELMYLAADAFSPEEYPDHRQPVVAP